MRTGRALIGLVVGGLLLFAVGSIAYVAGVQTGQASVVVGGGAPALVGPGYAYYGGFHPFLGFGGLFFALIAGLLFLAVIGAVIRAATRLRWDGHGGWGPGHSPWGRGSWGGPWSGGPDAAGPDGVPPMMAEIHRRMHEQEARAPEPHAAEPPSGGGTGGSGAAR